MLTDMEKTPVLKLLFRLAPPVMLALLIQSVYNIVDSYFIARYSAEGFTALSIFYPVQLLMLAFATGTGIGINILVSRMDGESGGKDTPEQDDVVKSGMFLGLLNYAVFTAIGLYFLKGFYNISSSQTLVRSQGVEYSQIVFIGSLGMFFEANCSKVLQAKGNMVIPMAAQVAGALFNVAADPVLIFGMWGFPELGMSGAAIATVAGQFIAMAIAALPVCRMYGLRGAVRGRACARIYREGFPSTVRQVFFTVYIVGLNLILKLFTEDAVTVLGIYYKVQAFYIIPLTALEQVILPVISYNYGAKNYARVRDTLLDSTLFSCAVMSVGVAMFVFVPELLISIFTTSPSVLEIGVHAFRVISASFIPLAIVMMITVYFQGIEFGRASVIVSLVRQAVLFVPLAWIFHYFGLEYVWYTFPVTETGTALCGLLLYRFGIARRRGK